MDHKQSHKQLSSQPGTREAAAAAGPGGNGTEEEAMPGPLLGLPSWAATPRPNP